MKQARTTLSEQARMAAVEVAEEIADRNLPTMDEATGLVYIAAMGNKIKPPTHYPEPKTRMDRVALIARDAYLMGVADGIQEYMASRDQLERRIQEVIARQTTADKSAT